MAPDNRQEKRGWRYEAIQTIGGLVAVGFGVFAVAGIATGAFIVGTDTAATIAGSTSGVIGSIVGAFFGIKVGTDQTRAAIEAQREEAAKAQVYAAHLSEEKAATVVAQAEAAAIGTRRSAQTGSAG